MGKNVILFIDDDPDMLRIARRVFSEPVYELQVAETGGEGLKRLRELNPDMVVLDFALPDFDGEEFIEILRYDPNYAKWRSVPILILSARAEFYGRTERFFGMGVLAFLVKPFGRHELVNVVDNLIRRVKFERRFARKGLEKTFATPIIPSEELEESINTIAGLAKSVLDRQPSTLYEDQQLDLNKIYNTCRRLLKMIA